MIIGAAESGVGAAILAKKQGFNTFVSDFGQIKPEYRQMLLDHDIDFEENKHNLDKILEADEVIKSPGIPDSSPVIKQILAKNINVISEIEFAARFTNAKKICITGSNGKTTTTTITYQILKNAGVNVGLAGNIGKSFAYQVATTNHDVYVLEISSFQLDNMYDFKADIAVITNITPDHLDRYDHNFQNYIDSKFRIIQNQTVADALVYNLDDEVTTKEIAKRNIKSRLYPFSIKRKIEGQGAYLIGQTIIFNINKEEFSMTLEELALQGKHNVYNSMAGGINARLEEIRKSTVKESLAGIGALEHRMEHVSTIRGVEFINDSKATNVNSVWYAMESVNKPIIWITGGVDKGNDYSILHPLVFEKVKMIICVGKDNTKILNEFGKMVEQYYETTSMEDAVTKAFYNSEPGDAVLLSPATASFDLFENYEDRGKKFKRAVQDL